MTARREDSKTLSDSTPLLGADDPPPFTVLNPDSSLSCLIISDHAGVAVPNSLGSLGLKPEDFNNHFAQDIGIQMVTERLTELLDITSIMCNYSRLVVDVNRRLDHPTAFVTMGETTPIPGNHNLTEAQKRERINAIYIPYHDEVRRQIKRIQDRGIVPVIISLHSFTPLFFNQERPWDVSVLWLRDPRIPKQIIEFYSEKGHVVGDNEPYDARLLRGSTINVHADAHGLPNALIEIRHDLIDTTEKADTWAKSLSECLEKILADKDLYQIFDGPMPDYDPEQEIRYFDELVKKAKEGDL